MRSSGCPRSKYFQLDNLSVESSFAAALTQGRKTQRSIDQRLYRGLVADCQAISLDHFICSRQHIRWNSEANLLGGFEINDELKISWRFNWEVARLRSFKYL